MVARVPGFELRDGDDRRGFAGAASNLLINGERPSSKTAASELLKRIPASEVLKIEVLSGSNAAVDVRGQSQLVNVVVKKAARQAGATTYVIGARHIQYSNRIGWIAQASRSIALSPKADLALDFQIPNLLGLGESHDTLVNGQGAVTGTRFQIGQPTNVGLQGSASLRWRPTASDSVNVNLQATNNWNSLDNTQYEYATTGALRSQLLGRTDYDGVYSAEFGGDWEHRFSPGLSVKLIALLSNSAVDQHDHFETFTAPSAYLTRTQDRSTKNGERIGRAQVKWSATEAHTLEVGGEGAFNYRDTTLDIVNTPRGGTPTPVPLAVADARVEELRGETFINDIWTVSPKFTLESGFNFELSRITQTGDQEKERSFNYPKPHVSATYVANPKNTFRFSLIRDVSQLDFAEFSSAVDFVNTSQTQGNPNLVPEKAWKSRVEWETRFAARTALTLAAFADKVEDVHDLVVINGFDAYGNIGDGTRYGVEVRAALPLSPIGLRNAELRFNGLYQQTNVTDPITGEDRSFSVPSERQGTPSGAMVLNAGNKDWAYLVNFRQNLPAISSSWGANLNKWSSRREYRKAEIYEYNRPRPRLDLYFETTAIKPVTTRFYVNNVIVASEERTRTFYVGDRSSGVVQKAEIRDGKGGPEGSRSFGIQVSGRF